MSTVETMADLVARLAPRAELQTRLRDLCDTRGPVYYYGCSPGSRGHFWHCAMLPRSRPTEVIRLPKGSFLDSVGCPENLPWNGHEGFNRDETEGVAVVRHLAGSTFLAFWDRSVDSRRNSVSVFACPGTWSFLQMIRIAASYFPQVWQRYTFPIVEYRA